MADADREKWDARHAEGRPGSSPAPAWLADHDPVLPRAGRALDVASGAGRLALWARARGLEVTAIDISGVGLARLRESAPDVLTIERDLELDPRLPRGPFDLVTCFHYRQPSLWPAMTAVLARGGVLVAELLGVANLERHAHPSRRWLADPGELRDAAAGLELLYAEEGWLGDRYSARLVARKSSP
ncbi:MAG: class I SAM-dependent methyltransferase [Sandaracinaceae bacterium]|nr:class I SAM-dependent methyltransferase [Sandaracinaceae bacterium]